MNVSLPLSQFKSLAIITVEMIPLMWLLPRRETELYADKGVCVRTCVCEKFIMPKYFVQSHTGNKWSELNAAWLQSQYY